MKAGVIENATSEIKLTMGLLIAIRLLAQLKNRRILIARTKRQLVAVNALIGAAEDFEEELSIVMEHGENDESPPEDLLRTLRAFQASWNATLETGWRP